MVQINLRDFYPFYNSDVFVEVLDEVAAELIADKRYEKAYKRRTHYNKAHYSLDVDDGIEATAVVCFYDSPERVFDLMDRHCSLCRALNSLPEIQGKRIDAHFLLDMSLRRIAEMEGVSKETVRKSIEKGLMAMKKYLKEF